LEVLDFGARSGFVHDLAIVALIVLLFRDGLEVEAEMLQREWHLPFATRARDADHRRARSALWLTGCWARLARGVACSAPCSRRTDPLLSSSCVHEPAACRRLVRHS
jgi:hypothetical protein